MRERCYGLKQGKPDSHYTAGRNVRFLELAKRRSMQGKATIKRNSPRGKGNSLKGG